MTASGELDFLTMEYLDSETLAQQLERNGALHLDEACKILRELCEGLEAAHQKIIHGDLKTSNIILTRIAGDGQIPVITDFGLARRVAGPVTSPLLAAVSGGTPAYMAPELQNGVKPCVASDIYALGVIFYEMLTGHLPPTSNAAGQYRFNYNLKLVRKGLPAIGHQLTRLLLSCLDPDPARRPATAIKIANIIAIHNRVVRLVRATAATAVILLAGPLIIYQPDRNPIRLAVLPFEAPQEQRSHIDLTSRRTADLLSRMGRPRRSFSVVPFSESMDRHVNSPEQACTGLKATHVLLGQLQQDGKLLSVRAAVMEACSQQTIKELALEYAAADANSMPVALAGLVTGALHLPPLRPGDRVKSAALPDYVAGQMHLQRDAEVDEAIVAFRRALSIDPHSSSIWGALGEAYRLRYKITNEGAYQG